jgi:uncharacterized Zn-binding protein involved in type VI secretion
MANTFKNYTGSCTNTSATTIYTVPAATTTIIVGCNLANTGSSTILVDVAVAGVYIVKDAPIPAGSALSVLDGKMIAETGHTVIVTSDSATGDCDVLISVLEQS